MVFYTYLSCLKDLLGIIKIAIQVRGLSIQYTLTARHLIIFFHSVSSLSYKLFPTTSLPFSAPPFPFFAFIC